jgi:hypothetical protein
MVDFDHRGATRPAGANRPGCLTCGGGNDIAQDRPPCVFELSAGEITPVTLLNLGRFRHHPQHIAQPIPQFTGVYSMDTFSERR